MIYDSSSTSSAVTAVSLPPAWVQATVPAPHPTRTASQGLAYAII